MRQIVLAGLAAASITCGSTDVLAATFDDIQFWVGTGTNQAALVIDWNDGKSSESLLWGYQWEGIATGLDMFEAVVAGDPRLFAHLGAYAWGTAVLGIGYDLDGDASFGVLPSLSFDAGGFAMETPPAPDDSRTATDADDHYVEGWNLGFWGYSLKPSEIDLWEDASVGATDRVLSDGAWDGYSFAPGFASSDPSEPVAAMPVPEPTVATLIILSGAILTCVRRKRSS